jgi:hypothetical protein
MIVMNFIKLGNNMELIIAILILLLALTFIWNVFSKNNDNKATSCFCVIMVSIIFTGVLIDYNSKDNPTALDVYQGKTTLEITYRDSISVDSVVVFKDEFKK